MYRVLTNVYKVLRETHERRFFTSPKRQFYLQQQNEGLKKEWNAKLETWQNDETAVVFYYILGQILVLPIFKQLPSICFYIS